MLEDVFRFAATVVMHWQAYVTGGVVSALVGVIERLSDWHMPKKYYAWLFLGFFFSVSAFMTWRAEYRNAQHLLAENQRFASSEAALRARIEDKEKQLQERGTLPLVPSPREAPTVAPLKERISQLSADILAFYSSKTAIGAASLNAGDPSKIGETVSLFSEKFLPAIFMLKQELRDRGITDPELEMAVQTVTDNGWRFPESIKTIGDRFSILARRLPAND